MKSCFIGKRDITVRNIKLRDLDENFIQHLRDKLGDEDIELEIRGSAGQVDCAGQEMNEELFWRTIEKFDWE